MIVAICAAAVHAGSIGATLKTQEPVFEVWAVHRKSTKVGVHAESTRGHIEHSRLAIADLPTGVFDLRFRTRSGVVEGWNANMPPSDYEVEQSLSPPLKQKIFMKLSRYYTRHFPDEVVVLDIQGNVQNATVLISTLRRRPFVGGGYKPGEWVWSVKRWRYEDPDEQSWVPYQEQPYYSHARERLGQDAYEAKHVTYARHLGGLVLTSEKPSVDLGTILIPRPRLGILAVNPDGSPVRPKMIKPWRVAPKKNTQAIKRSDGVME